MSDQVPGADVRRARRRSGPDLPAPRERAGPVGRGRRRLRPLWLHNGLAHARRREDVEVAGQLAARGRAAAAVAAGRAALLPGAAHYRSPMDYSGRRATRPPRRTARMEGFLTARGRADRRGRGARRCRRRSRRRWTTTSGAAGARGRARRGPARATRALAAGDKEPRGRALAEVRAMLGALGVDPLAGPGTSAGSISPRSSTRWPRSRWSSGRRPGPARTRPPPTRSATASRRRDRGRGHRHTAPAGRWSVLMARQSPAAAAAAAPRAGASKKGASSAPAVSAGAGWRAGPTPPAEGPQGAPGRRQAAAASRGEETPRRRAPRARAEHAAELLVGRNPVVEALRAGSRRPRCTSRSASTDERVTRRCSGPPTAASPCSRSTVRARPDDRGAPAPGHRPAGPAVPVRAPGRPARRAPRRRPAPLLGRSTG